MSTRPDPHLTPVVALYGPLGVNPITARRRANAGRYGRLYYPNGLACVAIAKVEAAIGRAITDAEIEAAHRAYNAKAKARYRARNPKKPRKLIPTLTGDLPLKGEFDYAKGKIK